MRSCCRSGYLEKMSENGEWKSRWFVLKDEELLCFHSHRSRKLRLSLSLGGVEVRPYQVGAAGLAFELLSENFSCVLRAPCLAACEDWWRDISNSTSRGIVGHDEIEHAHQRIEVDELQVSEAMDQRVQSTSDLVRLVEDSTALQSFVHYLVCAPSPCVNSLYRCCCCCCRSALRLSS